jgi:hypothetical protein
MNNRLIFTAIPNAVFDAYNFAEITPCMFLTLILLYKQADWATGRVAFTSASMLASRMQGQYSARTVQEALQNLHFAGWITSHHKKGSRRNYRVDLGNFTALTGALKGQVLNPTAMRDWHDAEDVDRADGRVDDDVFAREETRDESRDETATHQSPQSPQESTIVQTPTIASSAAACSQKNLTKEEAELLDHWYGVRLRKELTDVEPARIQIDLPYIQELISTVNGESHAVLSFVFTDPGDDKWVGWNKKSPDLPNLIKHLRNGHLLQQFRDSREEEVTPTVPSAPSKKKARVARVVRDEGIPEKIIDVDEL